ncbi:TPA: hypothetical protein ACX6SJ_001573 [Photobacterium damselae]
MIIEIINFDPEKDILSNNKICALENLFLSYRERNHIVLCDRKALKALIESKTISAMAISTIADIIRITREINAIKNKFSVIARVDFSKTEYIFNEVENEQNIINISYDFFEISARIQPSILITENDLDFELYNYITETYSKCDASLNVGLKIKKICGYGSHCYKVFKDHQDEHQFAMCIVDCDRKYPDAQLGSTAGQFKSDDLKVNGTVQANILNVREVESLLPSDLIIEAIKDGDYPSTMVDDFDKVERLNMASNQSFRKYFDHKDGISLKQAISGKNAKYWKSFFSEEQRIHIKDCYKTSICTNCDSCIKINGFGDKILENTLSILKKKNKSLVRNNLSSTLREDWDYIGRNIISWGCTPQGRRLRAS